MYVYSNFIKNGHVNRLFKAKRKWTIQTYFEKGTLKFFWPNFETGSNSLVGPEVIKFLTGKDSNNFSSFQIDDSEEVDQEPEVFQKKKPSRSARWAQKCSSLVIVEYLWPKLRTVASRSPWEP